MKVKHQVSTYVILFLVVNEDYNAIITSHSGGYNANAPQVYDNPQVYGGSNDDSPVSKVVSSIVSDPSEGSKMFSTSYCLPQVCGRSEKLKTSFCGPQVCGGSEKLKTFFCGPQVCGGSKVDTYFQVWGVPKSVSPSYGGF